MDAGRVRLLLVEDNPGDARLVREALRECADISIEIVDCLRAALESLGSVPADVILLDLGLPDSQGLDTARAVIAAAPGVPVVVLTGFDDARAGIEAVRAGAQDYLVKGTIPEGLLPRVVRFAVERQRAHHALQESEGRFRRLYEQSPGPYQSLDEHGVILEVNNAWLTELGYERDEVIGRWFGDILAGDGPEMFREGFADFKVRGEVHGVEFDIRRKGGDVITVSFEGRIARGTRGEFLQAHGVFTNVTARALSERLLQAERDNLRAVIDATPVALMVVDAGEQVTHCNPAAERLFGRGISDTQDRRCGELIGCAHRRKSPYGCGKGPRCRSCPVYESVTRVLETGTQVLDREAAMDVETTGGAEGRCFIISVEPLVLNGRRHAVVALHDITDRKQAEAALRESDLRFRHLLQNVPNIAVQGYEPDGTTRYWNEASERLYGYTAQEAIGRNLIDLIIPTEMRGEVEQAIQQMAKTGQPIPASEVSLMRKDGSRVSVFSSHATVQIPGQAPELFCIDIDITDRKRAIDALRESEERYRTLVEGMAEGVIQSDNDDRIRYVNSRFCKIVGRSADELVGKIGYEVFAPEEEWELIRAKTMERQRGASDIYESRMVRKDGTVVGVSICASPVYDSDGTVVGSVGLVSDITARKQAEQALREAVHALARAQQIGHLGNWDWDIPGERLVWSDELHRIWGVSKDFPLTQDSILSLIHPDDRQLNIDAVRRLLEADGTGSLEFRIIRPDGETRHVWQTLEVRYDDSGTPVRAFGVMQDVTERKLVEAHVRDSEARLRAAFEGLHDAVTIVSEDGRFVDCNQPALEMFRVESRIRFMERRPADFSPPFQPDGRESGVASRERVAQAMATGGFVQFEWWHQRVDGEVFPAEVILTTYRQGGRMLLQGMIRDITDQKRAEQELQQSRSREARLLANQIAVNRLAMALSETLNLEQVYRTVREHVWGLVDVWHFIISAYDEKAGLIRAEYASSDQTVYDVSAFPPIPLGEPGTGTQSRVIHSGEVLYTPDHARAVEHSRHRYIVEDDGAVHAEGPDDRNQVDTTRSVVYLPMKVKGKTIGIMQLQSTRRDAYTQEGIDLLAAVANVAAVAAQNARLHEEVLRELAERKIVEADRERLQSQLIQAQKMESIGRLAGGVAHDFNNMLQVVLGHVELTLMRLGPGDPLRGDLEEVQNAAQKSADLTRQLLAFARKQTVSPKVLDLNDTIAGMLKMLRRLIGEDVGLTWKPGAGLWTVKIDPSQVDQILANLCVNARDAIDGVGEVTIETENTGIDEAYCALHAGAVVGDYVRLSVTDTGCGMSPEVREHLFEPFFTTKGVGEGTGLGLPTVYGIVKQNEGYIDVYSEEGAGTTFAIYLPAFREALGEQLEPGIEEAPRGAGENVLLVEDDAAILRMAVRMLGSLGYRVVGAGSPAEAIQRAEDEARIDLLITDVVMPEMNGRDLAERVAEARPGVRCLYMSGYPADAMARRGVLEEGVHFLQKPFTIEALARKVREALRG